MVAYEQYVSHQITRMLISLSTTEKAEFIPAKGSVTANSTLIKLIWSSVSANFENH